jgi:hypothetical protein
LIQHYSGLSHHDAGPVHVMGPALSQVPDDDFPDPAAEFPVISQEQGI